MIILNKGNGCGKTRSALGTAIRTLGDGRTVLWVSICKEGIITSEVEFISKIEYSFNNKIKWFEFNKEVENTSSQLEASGKRFFITLDTIRYLIPDYDLIVLDELGHALRTGLVNRMEIEEILSKHKDKDFVLTGRNLDYFIDMADYVTEFQEIKHPYQKGIKAIKGLDY